MLEFVLVGVSVIFTTISIIEMGVESWNFHSMLFAIDTAARYTSGHGRTCTKNGNSCTIQVKDIATMIAQRVPGVSTSQLNVTLTPATTANAVSCTPLSNCTATNCPSGVTCTNNTAQFPGSTDNGVGSSITISANFTSSKIIPFFWLGSSGSSGQSYRLTATTNQTIVY